MARSRAARVTKPARVGLIALLVIVLAALAIFLIVRMVRGTGGYQIGVRFRQAAGVSPGSQVYFNGVRIGGVTKVKILPDTTVEFIINVFRDTSIPKNAAFTVQSSFTGGSSLAITVPPGTAATTDVWPRRVLPIYEQPVGTPPLSIETFMSQSKALGGRATTVLGMARPYGAPLLRHARHAQANAGATAQELRGTAPALLGSIRSTIGRAQSNVRRAQTVLQQRDEPKLAAIAQSFKQSAAQMQQAAGALQSIKRDPQIRQNVRDATAQLHAISATMAGLSRDMQTITGNRQTKAELQDASARLRALLHKI